MIQLANMGLRAGRMFGRMMLSTQRHLPTIMTWGGLGLGGFGAFSACRATLKASDVLDDASAKKQIIEAAHDAGETVKGDPYSETDYKKDRHELSKQTAWQMAKLYGPSVGMMIGGGAMILGGHHMLGRRLALTGGALAASQSFLEEYRDRVKKAMGDEFEQQIYYGYPFDSKLSERKDEETGQIIHDSEQNFHTKNLEENIRNQGIGAGLYSYFFDESNPNWDPDPQYNKLFLTKAQNIFSDKLRKRGYVFLSEVLDYLKIEPNKAAYYAGWIYDPTSTTRDNQVDFGLANIYNADVRAFMNGERVPAVLLDFNVDGNILKEMEEDGSFHNKVAAKLSGNFLA